MADVKIYGKLTPGTTDNELMSAENIFDHNQQQFQSEINANAKSSKKYIHKQTSPSNIWNINHNLNNYCIVQLYDSNGEEFIADIIHTDVNHIIVKINDYIIGMAVCV